MKKLLRWMAQVLYLLWKGWAPRRRFGRWVWFTRGQPVERRISAVLRAQGTWPGARITGPRPARGKGKHRCPSCYAVIEARRCKSALHQAGTVIFCPACNQPARPGEWRTA
jgi:hypothetical protein